ncbi:hypothetical protein J7J50_02595 [Lysobacter sp. ISL-50]|nr:hypothetical protein [Lysobacter sp. ISL-50]MBT2775410.1 hypothetical protein [Lysobacter sp. ISL-54]MBT2783533.1 hypothetical protein [Lysobacter sp. ISL-52]
MWVQLAIMVVSYFLSKASQPKPPQPTPAAFGDFQFPQSTEGTPQAVVFGDVWTGDWMVLGVGQYRTVPIKQKGGKGK